MERRQLLRRSEAVLHEIWIGRARHSVRAEVRAPKRFA